MGRRPGLAKQRLTTHALLLRRVPYGEADSIVTLFTERAGAVPAIARGARRSHKRFAALEPLHLLRATMDVVVGRDLATLIETHIERPRLHITGSLARMEAGGQALRWLRSCAPTHTPEPGLWLEVNGLLEALDAPPNAGATEPAAEALLAAGGLRLLMAAGWGLDLTQCVRCETPCPERARCSVDVQSGGVVCRRCGGGGIEVSSRQRRRLLEAMEAVDSALEPEDAALAITLVERTLVVHGTARQPDEAR